MTLEDNETNLLAGQYVLGTLSSEEVDEVTRALPGDPDLALAVAYWKQRMGALDPLAPKIAPSDLLWPRVERSIRNEATPMQTSARRPRERGWQIATALAVAACMVLAIFAVRPDTIAPSSAKPTYAVVLQAPETRNVTWLVQANATGAVQLVPVSKPDLPEGQSYQFWTKAVGADRPVSLGVVPVGGSVTIRDVDLPALEAGQLFEVTLEPYGGSPTGLPTGQVLGVGNAVSTS